MLRIDAKSLDVSKLKIRTLDKLFQIMKNNDINNPFLQGENSGLSYIYKQRKTPFEYMYSMIFQWKIFLRLAMLY